MIKIPFYLGLAFLLAVCTLSSCTDSNEGQKPHVVEVSDATMTSVGWKWAVSLSNQLRMQGSPDVNNGGYFVQVDDMNSYDAIFACDDKCRVSEACINSVWYYFFYQGNTLHVSYKEDGNWKHTSFGFQATGTSEGDAFKKIAANLKAVFQKVTFLPKPVMTDLDDLFAAVSRGAYNTSSAMDGDENMQNFCSTVYYYESGRSTLRKDLFETDMFVHYAHERTADYNQVGILVAPINNTTFNRGYGTDVYGEETENKVYCGLLFSTSPDPTLANCEYITNMVPLEPVDDYVWVDVPEDLEDKTYYVRAFMVSEQEKEKVERGEYIHPHLVRYEEGGPDSMEQFYGGEMRLDNLKVFNESVVNKVLTVELSGNLSLPGNLSEAVQGIGLEMKARPIGETYNAHVGNVEPGPINQYIRVEKRDFKELDTNNFVARGEWLLTVYAGWVCIGAVPFTVVYDKQPSIRYADLTSDGTTVTYKKIFEGALWFESNVKSMWEGSNGPIEYSSAFANDQESEYSIKIDDTDLISYKQKTTGEYMETMVNGKELRSNRLVFVRDSEGKRTSIHIAD